MRDIDVEIIRSEIKRLCIQANKRLPSSLEERLATCAGCEKSSVGRGVLNNLLDNITAAREEDICVCQDTGMAVIFLSIGQDVHLVGGLLKDAVNRGVADAYVDGYMRCSVVSDPLERINTGNNSPCILYTDFVEGDKIQLDVCPKGFGSENMSALKMFTPATSVDDIISFVTECASKAGSNPCPPVVMGVGIGGTFDYSAVLAKKALCRNVALRNPDPRYAELEQRMLESVNNLGIGPQGFGGECTALAVNIEAYATHIAGLPVAVNMGCHVTRHASAII